jgi:STE24 endopeptidase
VAARTHLTRCGVVRLGAVAATAVLVAEGAVWLLRPRQDSIPPATVSEQAYFSTAELERASDFRDGQRLIGLGVLAVEGGLLVTLALWRPPTLRNVLRGASQRPIVGAAAVGAGISLTLAVARLPLGAVAQSRAREVGLSTQTFASWLGDQGRSAGIAALLAALGGAATVALVRRLDRRFWIGGTVLVVAGAAIFIWLAPVLLAPIFNRFEPLPDGRTRSEVLALADRAGVTVGQVYRVDASRRSTALNAYVDGIGPTKRVVIYDNALRELSPGELNAVVAHELAHVKGDDILRGLAFIALVAPLGVLFVQLSAQALTRRSGDDIRSPAGLPALALSAAAAALVLGVPGNQLSRAVESRADAYALELTREPGAFVDLQKRLALTNVADPSPPGFLQFVFGTHPTTMQRIGAAVAYANSTAPASRQAGD